MSPKIRRAGKTVGRMSAQQKEGNMSIDVIKVSRKEFYGWLFGKNRKTIDDGSWNVNGCCGGGCYVLSEIRFCPYCGRHLTKRAGDVCPKCLGKKVFRTQFEAVNCSRCRGESYG